MTPNFAAVTREPRLPDKVAMQLQRTILSGGLKPGERLATERELGDQFGVSRTVIREAVRSLVAKGLLEPGSGSGVRVATVGSAAVRETMGMYLRVNGEVDYGNLHEIRSTLETAIVCLAAERATEADLELLRQSCQDMQDATGDFERVSKLDVEFHRLIAQATHNDLFVVILDSIGDILLDVRRATVVIAGRQKNGLRHHRAILKCLVEHDVDAAHQAMIVHLDDARRAWEGLSAEETGHVLPV